MCTVVILRRPGHPWPLIIGANRDEMATRPWKPPARHWPDRPDVTAGLDIEAGGSWLGLNDYGVMAAALNRPGTLGPAAGKRSRGELVLEALDHAEAEVVAEALGALNPDAYRPFNLVVADPRQAFWLAHRETGKIEVTAIPEGLSMLTAHDLNDPASGRIRHYRPLFEAVDPPMPDEDDWGPWQTLLASSETGTDEQPQNAMCFQLEGGFGTRSSSLLALPAAGSTPPGKPRWWFNPSAADAKGWHAVM